MDNDQTALSDDTLNLDNFANDFRDSFRGFKSALIKDNNLLDASEFHRCELYCKEIELYSKETKILKDKVLLENQLTLLIFFLHS